MMLISQSSRRGGVLPKDKEGHERPGSQAPGKVARILHPASGSRRHSADEGEKNAVNPDGTAAEFAMV